MTTPTDSASTQREPELVGQTVVLIGGSAGIGLETARRARTEGAEVILTGRNTKRLAQAAQDVGARSTAAFDANDALALKGFFDELPEPIHQAGHRSRSPSHWRSAPWPEASVSLGSEVVTLVVGPGGRMFGRRGAG